MLDTRQLRYFIAIFETGSLSKASNTLRVATSALSHHLNNLETFLEVRLFERKPRGLSPTAAGHRLYSHATGIIAATIKAKTDVQDAGKLIAGPVSIGMTYSATKVIGVELARQVLDELPKVSLNLTESLSGSTLISLMRAEVDVALVYNPPPDSRLKTQPVLQEKMVLIGTQDIIGSSHSALDFAEVLDLPLIMLRQGASARALLDDGVLLKRMESSAILQMNSVQAITGSVVSGLGCAIATTLLMDEQIKKGLVSHRPIKNPELVRTLHICELSERKPTFALEAIKRKILRLVK
ncbi:MAG: LysR substrate-binding domain-containing protein, partial [Gammaproteobacteria bacterium]